MVAQLRWWAVQPPGTVAPSATSTVLHAPTRTGTVDTDGGAGNVPASPVLAAQVIVQFAVAVTGHAPDPPVRSGVERSRYMYAQEPAAGSAVVSTDGPGFTPSPWQLTVLAPEDEPSAAGSPMDQVTDVNRAVAVTDTAPAVAVAVTAPGSSTHRYSQYFAAILLPSGPKCIDGSGIGNR